MTSRLDRIGKKICWLAIAAGATVGLAVSGCSQGSSTAVKADETRQPTVRVVTAAKTTLPILRHPNGMTRPLSEVTIRARVRGFLKEKHFEEGSNVKKNQLLLVIEEEPFKVAVAQAQAKLEAAIADLEKSKASRAPQVARAQKELNESQLDLAKVEERRESKLLSKAATSRENYDRALAMRKKADAQVRADEANLEQALADYKINVITSEANIEKAKADLDQTKIDLGYCRMFSPIDGRAGELMVKLGNLVGQPGSTTGDSLLSIKQLDPMGVDLRPAAKYLPYVTRVVRSGLEVRLRVEGQRPHPYPGKVVFIDNTVDQTTSTVLIKAEVPNPEQNVLPGEYVKVDMQIGDYADVIAVPEQAVIEGQDGTHVLVVDAQNKVARVAVKALDTYHGLSILESGVEPGLRVIVEGIQLVRPGQTVKVEEVDLQKYDRPDIDTQDLDELDSPLVRLRGEPTKVSPPAMPSTKGMPSAEVLKPGPSMPAGK